MNTSCHEVIARRAYERFLNRGVTHGHDVDDWLIAEREASLLPGFNIGILIIGSLFWSVKAHRVRWREERLVTEKAIRVEAPIRYGRQSRSGSFTMILSNALSPDREGTALVVPCKYPATTAEALIHEAEALWAAEQPEERAFGPISDRRWGAVGLLCNPVRRTMLSELRTAWANRVTIEREAYRTFPSAVGEQPVLSDDGMLTIRWPRLADGFDFLLATPNRPKPFADRTYPSAVTIAEAWRAARDQHYFDENRSVGIHTADDDQITIHLNSTD